MSTWSPKHCFVCNDQYGNPWDNLPGLVVAPMSLPAAQSVCFCVPNLIILTGHRHNFDDPKSVILYQLCFLPLYINIQHESPTVAAATHISACNCALISLHDSTFPAVQLEQ